LAKAAQQLTDVFQQLLVLLQQQLGLFLNIKSPVLDTFVSYLQHSTVKHDNHRHNAAIAKLQSEASTASVQFHHIIRIILLSKQKKSFSEPHGPTGLQ